MPSRPQPAGGSERDQLLAYLVRACAGEPELIATANALAEAGEIDLLRLFRDFRDNHSDEVLLARQGGCRALLDERLRLIHRVYVDQARAVREQMQRPLRARSCYLARMLAR